MPPWLLYTLGVLIFAFGLLASIALHEIGHMVPAKRFGVKVTQYMVGFGPTAWSRKKGETEYGIKWVPLGGYIRMIGMVPPRADGTRSRWPRRMATAIEDFRQVSRAEVSPDDEDRQFYRLTPGKKMIIMLGGPSMNLLIYLVLTVVLLTTLGQPHKDPTTTIGSVSECVVPATPAYANLTACPTGAAKTPAFLAGIRPEDRIVSVNGTPVSTWDQVINFIEPAAGTPLHLVVDRSDRTIAVTITPVANTKSIGGTNRTHVVGFLGVGSKERRYFEPLTVAQIPGEIGRQLNLGVHALARYPEKIKSLFGTVFEGKKRDPQGAVGVVGISRISGEYAQTNLLTAQEKFFTLISLLASVNLLLFLFNLLPLLPLDGGHVAGALVESVKRGVARLRARRQPALAGRHRTIFVDTASMLPVMYAVASVLIVMTLLTLYADIVKPIDPFGG